MIATLKPLDGKYYGTEIEVKEGKEHIATIKLWDDGDYTPSGRYLAEYGYTTEQWETNAIIHDDGWTGHIKNIDLVCDSHFESKLTYERALKIISAINQIQ
jgi:hypothetical protein